MSEAAADSGTLMGRAAARRLAALDVCHIAPGLTDSELARAEQLYGIEFSPEHRAFLAAGLPVNSEDLISDEFITYAWTRPWPDWRSGDPAELRRRLAWPVDGALFDVEHNGLWHRTWGPAARAHARSPGRPAGHLADAPAMIPLYAHSYLPSGNAITGHPVLSIYQTDIIVYGTDLDDYITNEFSGQELAIPPDWTPPALVPFWSEFLLRAPEASPHSGQPAPFGKRHERAFVAALAEGPARRQLGRQNTAMTGQPLADLAETAGQELALRLRIPCDIVDVHRLSGSRARIYTSLRFGAFLLAYAPLESFFTQLTRYADRTNGRALPLNLDKIQREFDLQWPGAGIRTNLWEGRTRQPSARAGHRSEWVLLRDGRLKGYLSDMKRLRDLLSHGRDPVSVTNDGHTLWKVRGGWSLRLMGVEGFIEFAEDLAEQALLEAGVPRTQIPSWPEPQRSGISLRGLPSLPNRDRLAGGGR